MTYALATTFFFAALFGLGVFKVNQDSTYETRWGVLLFCSGIAMLAMLVADLLWISYSAATWMLNASH